MYPTLLYDFVTFWARIGLVLVKMKPSWAASAEFVSEWQPLHPLPELVDSNKQPYPWMRPEAAHCSLEASESESCCQATAYRWGGVWGGGRSSRVLHCCPRPCLSFVIIASRSDLPGLELLIWFCPSINIFPVPALPENLTSAVTDHHSAMSWVEKQPTLLDSLDLSQKQNWHS